jgi:hypothetical protein
VDFEPAALFGICAHNAITDPYSRQAPSLRRECRILTFGETGPYINTCESLQPHSGALQNQEEETELQHRQAHEGSIGHRSTLISIEDPFHGAYEQQICLFNNKRRDGLFDLYKQSLAQNPNSHLSRLGKGVQHIFAYGCPASPWSMINPSIPYEKADYLLFTEQ